MRKFPMPIRPIAAGTLLLLAGTDPVVAGIAADPAGNVHLGQVAINYWPALLLVAAMLLGLAVATFRFARVNRLLKKLSDDNVEVVRELLAAQEELQDSEEKFRTVADFTADWEYWITPDQRFAYVAPAALQITGYAADEFIGDPSLLDAIIYPEDRPRFLDHIDRYLNRAHDGELAEIEFRIRRKDGEIRWIGHRCRAVYGSGDRYLGRRVSNRDITERKQADEQLRLAAKVMEESNEGIMVTDRDNRIVSVNRAFSDITGYLPEDVVGRDPRLLASGRHGEDFYKRMWGSISATGYWQGEIWDRRKNEEIFPGWLSITAVRADDGRIANYVAIFSDITERKSAQAQIEFLAHHDPLTGLPNRLLLQDRIEQAIAHAARTGQSVALLFLDLDRFKAINDTLGHQVGDKLLRAVVDRIGDVVRETDTISRLGGDEFLILISEIESTDSVTDVARRILQRCAEPFEVDGHLMSTSASIGIAIYPEDGVDFDTLLKKADTALYHAKDAGRNDFHFFSESMNAGAVERVALEARLRGALENKEFMLHYQPQVDIESGLLVGVEALIRWDSPELGRVPPAKFIPVAEESGLIVPIGHWVLRESCRQVRAWEQQGLPQLTISVNLSALQFRRGDFVRDVAATLRENGLEPERLELELTESILIDEGETVMDKVRSLKQLGVRLAIDDFGTGYSSLSYLKRFAVDRLKIDQSFVHDIVTDPNDAAIVRAIIQLGRSFGLTTIAEGVESVDQLEFLAKHGCDEVQGYHFAPPMPADEFARWASAVLHA
jgi:diguanylate cyclase (GGDEF)-like protein/PAS domain S-box-containing protein